MNFHDYQAFAPSTAVFQNFGPSSRLAYLGLGLMGEVQEWAESPDDIKELGDIMWYVAMLCWFYDWDMGYFWYRPPQRCYHPNLPEALKKALRDDKDAGGVVRDYIAWVFMTVASYLISTGKTHDEVLATIFEALQVNHDKLTSRKERGVLKGDGNDR